jgi:hypothetical protein
MLVSVLGGTVYRVSMYLLGLSGAIALFVPKQALRFSMNISYESSEAIEWKDGLVPVIRGFGVLYLLIAFNEVKTGTKRRDSGFVPATYRFDPEVESSPGSICAYR